MSFNNLIHQRLCRRRFICFIDDHDDDNTLNQSRYLFEIACDNQLQLRDKIQPLQDHRHSHEKSVLQSF